jgi:ABC-type lipoprotein export system ATPase subunit/GNAT superfamily N-acetyltransferase
MAFDDRQGTGWESIDVAIPRPGIVTPTARTGEVALQFGLPVDGGGVPLRLAVSLPLSPGSIVAVCGPSGSGKSSLLAAIERVRGGGGRVEHVRFSDSFAVVDQIAPGSPLSQAVEILSACGLGEPRLWLRRFSELSDGEAFRARLAGAFAACLNRSPAGPLLCDEFASSLHRRAARAISFNLRRLVSRSGLCLVLACSPEDVLADLRPDVVVRLSGGGRADVEARPAAPAPLPSFARRLSIEPGGKADYDAFAAMHYKSGDELGFVDRVFVMRERPGGEALGIVVYSFAPLELRLRNEAFPGRFVGNPAEVNRSLRILRRLVIHPDVRGCGLGRLLVRRTLPRVGTPLVECLSTLGQIHPVFERAGMRRVGDYGLSPSRRAAMAELAALGVDPLSRSLAQHVGRRPRVRRIVAAVVHDWYRGTTGGGASRVQHQSPAVLAQTFRGLIGLRPVYYVWQRPPRPRKRRPSADRQNPEQAACLPLDDAE